MLCQFTYRMSAYHYNAICQSYAYIFHAFTILYVTKSEDEKNPKNAVYECPDCEHKTINPEPDEDGDRVCEDCGCILPEKEMFECDICKHENIEPEKNEDGDYLCENCGSALDIEVNRFFWFFCNYYTLAIVKYHRHILTFRLFVCHRRTEGPRQKN